MRQLYTGHTSGVNAVGITADGKRIISGSSDKTLRCWNRETAECDAILQGHTDEITSLALLPGKQCVSGSKDSTLRVWDLEKGTCLRVLEGHGKSVNALSITAAGKLVVSASSDCRLKLWEVETGKLLRNFERHPAYMYRDGLNRLMRSSNQEFAYHDFNTDLAHDVTYDVENSRFFGHADDIVSVSVSADGKTVFSGGTDNTLRMWDASSGECRWLFGGHNGGPGFTVYGLAITRGGKAIVSGGSDIQIWGISNKKIRRALWGIKGEKPRCRWKASGIGIEAMALSPKGNRLAVSSGSRPDLKLYKLRSGKCVHVFPDIPCVIRALVFSPDGETIIAAGKDGKVMEIQT
ncbi:MAG: WD40 repeat domain-containing protein [bacterium]|nr:WD40 repeat domain-containing protein [bacterium]